MPSPQNFLKNILKYPVFNSHLLLTYLKKYIYFQIFLHNINNGYLLHDVAKFQYFNIFRGGFMSITHVCWLIIDRYLLIILERFPGNSLKCPHLRYLGQWQDGIVRLTRVRICTPPCGAGWYGAPPRSVHTSRKLSKMKCLWASFKAIFHRTNFQPVDSLYF